MRLSVLVMNSAVARPGRTPGMDAPCNVMQHDQRLVGKLCLLLSLFNSDSQLRLGPKLPMINFDTFGIQNMTGQY